MSQTPLLPSYIDFAKLVQKIQLNSHPAQIHGFLCGNICATSGIMGDLWGKVFPSTKPSSKNKEFLQRIYEATYHQLSEFSFEFSLVLPDDEADINVRAEGLGLWCQGFLTGLEQSPVSIRKRAPAEVTEALDDIIEIAKINFGDISPNEEDETAYFELVEYIRLNVLMIFHELKTDDDLKDPNNDTLMYKEADVDD